MQISSFLLLKRGIWFNLAKRKIYVKLNLINDRMNNLSQVSKFLKRFPKSIKNLLAPPEALLDKPLYQLVAV